MVDKRKHLFTVGTKIPHFILLWITESCFQSFGETKKKKNINYYKILGILKYYDDDQESIELKSDGKELIENDKNDDIRYACEQCDFTCVQKHVLEEHIGTVHAKVIFLVLWF